MAGNGQLAIVTGASTGIGFELAHIAAEQGYDLLVVADEALINNAADDFRRHGTDVVSVEADLSTFEGNDKLIEAAAGRPVALLLANAGRGLGKPFLEQNPAEWRAVIDTNVTGTTYLLQKIGNGMKTAGSGKILITGSIAGLMPGSFQAVYNGTKAYLDSFSYALREEMRDTGVTVTVLMPGATETEFFERGDMMDTKVGTAKKDDAGKVAKDGWDAMMAGSGHVVSGWQNKLQAAMSHILPDTVLAKLHRGMAEPGTAE
jgi:short-subunit dehydrogenase